MFHLTGLGFRGFRKIETEDVVNKRTMTSVFDPELLGAEVMKATPTDTIVRKYVMERAQDKTVLLKLQKETMKSALDGTEKIATYKYNEYGQAISASTSYDAHNWEEKSFGYQNVENASLYLLGLPNFNVTKSHRNDSVIIQEVRLDYDNRYLPVQKGSFINGNEASSERYEYNDRQQLVRKQQRAYESTDWLTKKYVYDADGRLLKEVNPMGLSTDYAYDPATGLLQSSADHKGRITHYEYDSWGRLIGTRHPDGRVKQVSTAWSNSGEPGLYAVTANETGNPVTKTYYDFLKREVRTSQIRFDGREMKKDKVYNIKTGLLEKNQCPLRIVCRRVGTIIDMISSTVVPLPVMLQGK